MIERMSGRDLVGMGAEHGIIVLGIAITMTAAATAGTSAAGGVIRPRHRRKQAHRGDISDDRRDAQISGFEFEGRQ
jgi:hypothetical protein